MIEDQPNGQPFGDNEHKSDVHQILSAQARDSRDFLDGRAHFARYIHRTGEIDSEEFHHHREYVRCAYRTMEHLPLDEQRLLEMMHPLAGAEPIDLNDKTELEKVANDLGTDSNGVRRLYVDALERFGADFNAEMPD